MSLPFLKYNKSLTNKHKKGSVDNKAEQTLHQRRYTDGKEACKYMFFV